jgi:DNA helicase-2/ATP-dependent DNA helicase PcrA
MFVTETAPADAAPWLAELNPEQRAAALHRDGHLLVLAGAGTGKTTTLCARVASLIGSGVPAERILLLTFTRRAAREMLTRARALTAGLRSRSAQRVLGGTFHSVAHRFVRGHAAALGLSEDFAVLDAGDAADLLDLVRQEQGHGDTGRRFPRKQTLADIYSRTVNAQRPVREVVAESFPWCEEHLDALGPLFKAFAARKRALGAIDLDDLLLLWRALMADETAGAHIAASFDHVLVDEYQDVNGLQVAIAEGFAARSCHVTAVGDDFQAIYAFRSASARHILEFPERFAGADTVTLERNYRATQPLLDVANAVAAQDEAGYPKVLRAEREGGTRPALVFCRDQAHEAVEVCDRVLAAREEGMLLREQAVLARTGHDTDTLELELGRRRIPFVKYGGLRYLEAAHVKDFLAVLRLCDRPADEMAWFRVLQLLDGVGPARARRAADRLVADSGGAVAVRWEAAREELPATARELADPLVTAIAASGDTAAGPAVERLRDALAPLVRAHYVDGAVRVHDLDAIAGMAGDATDVRTFAAELVLDPPASAADLAVPPHLDDDWLVLSTVHSAKGLEWQSVHLLAAYDGNFPACMSAGTSEEIAEERRLLYVALTRAQRSLSIYVPRRYYHRPQGRDDSHGYGKASRFLTPEVQARCDVRHLADDARRGPFAPPPGPPKRIAVSVDSLFD